MLSFKQSLEAFKQTNLFLYRVVTAEEVSDAAQYYDVALTDQTFELVCEFVYDYFISYDFAISDTINELFYSFSTKYFKPEDLTDTEKAENLDKYITKELDVKYLGIDTADY